MFILASASPRRRDLLAQIGASFRVEVSEAEEVREAKTAEERRFPCSAPIPSSRSLDASSASPQTRGRRTRCSPRSRDVRTTF